MRVDRFTGFLIAGGAATLVNYCVFSVVLVAGAHHLVAATVGYASGIGVSFAINRRMAFRGASAVRHRGARYTLTYLGALTCQLLLLETLVRAGIVPIVANALAIGVVVVLNYFMIARFVFPPSR